MSRLIDADDLIEYIKIWEIGNSISSDQKEFIDCVNKQLTAFDVDEVVEQLETRKARATALQKENTSEYFEGETDAFEEPEQHSQNGHYLSVDLGLHNLMTCYDSGNGRTFILGRKYLSLERYFHKEIARVQSAWYAQQSERGIKYPKSSKHIQRLYRKKQNTVKDYLHKVTRWIAEYCKKEDIRCVVVGDIRNIRKEKDMGHKTNQKFHGLPYNRLYIMLEYKLKLYGIQLVKQEESYTSQCSPLSPEVSKRYAEASNRKERGIYITDGVRFNADAVGAFNILRKYLSVSGKQKELSVTGLKTPEIIKVAA